MKSILLHASSCVGAHYRSLELCFAACIITGICINCKKKISEKEEKHETASTTEVALEFDQMQLVCTIVYIYLEKCFEIILRGVSIRGKPPPLISTYFVSLVTKERN